MAKAPLQPVATSGTTQVRVRRSAVQKAALFENETDPQILALKEYAQPKQLVDPFAGTYTVDNSTSFTVVEPPYNPAALLRLPNENAILKQCIAAMVTNVHGHGYALEYTGPEGGEDSKAAQDEKKSLTGLLDYPNEDYNITELGKRVQADLETLGYAYIELGRDTTRRVDMLKHLPAHTMRITNAETATTPVKVVLPRVGGPTEQTINKRFRRYVQKCGVRNVYFKEYGDPRVIDPTTGKASPGLALADSATEVIYLSLYNPASVYGLPRWFNQLPAVLGSRQSELTNLEYFKENAIPALAVLVSGGQLTSDSMDAIESHMTAARGRRAQNRVMVLEAQGSMDAAGPTGTIPAPKVELQTLHKERQGDALFQGYEANNRDKVRSSFRLPPLFVGLADDMTYATAKTSYEVAETQVFKPERTTFDSMIQDKVLAGYAPKYWRYASNPPKLNDPDELTSALEAFSNLGALTPNVTIAIASRMLGVPMEKISEPWGDFPFPLVLAAFNANKLQIDDLQNVEEQAADLGPDAGGKPDGAPAAAAGQQTGSGKKPIAVSTASGKTQPANDKTGDKTGAKTGTKAKDTTTKKSDLSQVRRQLRSLSAAARKAAA